jgi:hypothetical protein
MASLTETIYSSPNGDRWLLVCDSESGEAIIRHEANEASGGMVSEQSVDAFLATDGQGPEHLALQQMILSASEDAQ